MVKDTKETKHCRKTRVAPITLPDHYKPGPKVKHAPPETNYQLPKVAKAAWSKMKGIFRRMVKSAKGGTTAPPNSPMLRPVP